MPQPLERDLDETRSCLVDWFARVIPDGSDFEVGELRGPSDTGFSSDTLIFELAHRRDGRLHRNGLVARIEPAGAFPIFPTYDVALQFHTMRAMGEKAVPVPAMRWLEEDESVLGSPFYVMERIEGSVPTDTPPYHQGGWVSELAPADRGALWWSGLEAMARVHCLDPADPDFDFLPRPPARQTPAGRAASPAVRASSRSSQRHPGDRPQTRPQDRFQ